MVPGARLDARTGLPGRDALTERLAAAVARAAADGSAVAVLLVDLDAFRDVNAAFGHAAGDALLAQLAPRLRAAVRPEDLVARLGGDEFAVVCERLGGAWDADALARGLRDAWADPFEVAGDEVFATASTGIAVASAGRADPDALLREAAAALGVAKARGRGEVERYDDAMRAAALERVRLERDLRRALAAGDIDVAFQPIVDLRDGRPRAAEALVRWIHPERGAVSPGVFVPVAEASGLIHELGRHVLRTACREAARWRRELPGGEDLWVSVNVSARQVARGELPGDVRDALRESGLAPEGLALELTESALMEGTAAPGAALATLRALGVRIVLDDFGTGYSSLSYLRQFPLDGLKLDRAFVDGLALPDAGAVAEAMIGIGTRLGLTVTAEGIETREHAERLRALGCTLGQGYVLARPLPAREARLVLGARLAHRAPAPHAQARAGRNES